MEARTIKGAKPNAIDAMVECEQRGYGALKTAGFQCGVLRATTNFKPVEPSSARRAGWEKEGFDWATAEIASRASDLTKMRMLSDRQIIELGYNPADVTAACLAADEEKAVA